MEKKTRKPRQPRDPNDPRTHAWDPLGKQIKEYRRKILAVHREIDDLAQKGENRKVSTPSYVQVVITPLARLIAEKSPVLGVVLNEKIERQTAKDAYYKLQIGELTLGGLSYPGPNATHINFTIFAHDRPWGKVIQIFRLAQLLKIVSDLAGFLELDKQTDTDEQQ